MTYNFGLQGVGSNLTFGKQGGRLDWNSAGGYFSVTAPDGSTLTELRVALGTPSSDYSVPSKKWVQDEITANVQGLNIKNAVRVATTAPIAGTYDANVFTASATGVVTIDGVNDLAVGDRVLLKDQTDAKQNGIYVVTTVGTAEVALVLTRSEDANNAPQNEVTPGMFTFVTQGTANNSNGWVLVGNDADNDGVFDLGTEDLIFAQFSGAGQVDAGNGLSKDGNTLNANTDGVTTYIDGSDNIAVKSSTTAGQVLRSVGSGSAEWGALDLANSSAITGVLPAANGGLGLDISGYTGGELLVGSTGGVSTLAAPADGADYVLQFNDTTNTVEWVDRALVGGMTFTTLAVSGQDNVVAETTSDTLTLAAGTGASAGLIITTDAANDTITFGLDINGTTAGAANLAGTDKVVVYNGTNNVSMTGQELADGVYALTDHSRITDDAFTFVDTNVTAKTVTIAAGNSDDSASVNVATFAAPATDNAAAPTFNFTTGGTGVNEVRVEAKTVAGTEDVDIRLVPQAGGQVFIGEAGSGQIQSDNDYALTVLGGDANATGAGELFLGGGAGAAGVDSGNGGDVVLFGGAADGGVAGKVYYSTTYTVGGAYTPVANEEVATIGDLVAGVDLTQLTSTAAATADTITFYDASASDVQVKRTFGEMFSDLDVVTTASITSGILTKTADDTYVGRTLTAGTSGGIAIVDGDGVAGNPTISLDIAGMTEATTLADTDILAINDGVSNKKVTWANVKAEVVSELEIDTTQIISADGLTSVGTESGDNNGSTDAVVISAKAADASSDIVAKFSAAATTNTSGSHLVFTQGADASNEVIVKGADTAGSAAVDIRLAPQAGGKVNIGAVDATGSLTVTAATTTGNAVKVEATGSDTDVSMQLLPKGTGKVYYGAVDANNEVATVGNIASNTDPLVRRATATADSVATSFNVGAALANVAGKTYSVDRIIIKVTSAFDADTGAVVKSASGTLATAAADFDLTTVGTYIVDVPMTDVAGDAQFVLADFAAAPTSGAATVTVQYRVL